MGYFSGSVDSLEILPRFLWDLKIITGESCANLTETSMKIYTDKHFKDLPSPVTVVLDIDLDIDVGPVGKRDGCIDHIAHRLLVLVQRVQEHADPFARPALRVVGPFPAARAGATLLDELCRLFAEGEQIEGRDCQRSRCWLLDCQLGGGLFWFGGWRCWRRGWVITGFS